MARSRYAMLLMLAAACGPSGCSTFDSNTEILSLDLRQDSPRAAELTHLGARHYRNGNVEKAERVFQQAIAADETYGPAHNNLGLLYFDQRDLYEAAWAFQRATEFMPERAEPFNNLGLTYEAAGRLEDAIEMYYSAYELDPTHPEYLGNLIRARVVRGDDDDSMRVALQELLFIEKRRDWIDWAEDQLALKWNQPLIDPNAARDANGSVSEPEMLPVPLGSGPPISDQPPGVRIESPPESEIPLGAPRIEITDE